MTKMKKSSIVFILLVINFCVFAKIEELNLKSENGSYKELNNQKIFFAQGNAHVIIDNNEIFADEMEIYLNKDDTVEKAIFKKKIRIFISFAKKW